MRLRVEDSEAPVGVAVPQNRFTILSYLPQMLCCVNAAEKYIIRWYLNRAEYLSEIHIIHAISTSQRFFIAHMSAQLSPEALASIIFGIIQLSIGLIALWQQRQHSRLHCL